MIFSIVFFSPFEGLHRPAPCTLATGSANLGVNQKYKCKLTKNQLEELEGYIVGVVAAEMPALYNINALKAQAVCARTYALRGLEKGLGYDEIYQAHINMEEMHKKWGSGFDTYYDRVKTAVEETGGCILVYNSEPALAVFSASSCGKTEDSGNIWGESLPYLKTVESPWDNVIETKSFDIDYIKNVLGGVPTIKAVSDAGYVTLAMAGNKEYTGAEIRQCLGLKSSAFTVEVKGNKVYFTTRGYGHGVGMSQTGAEGMAKEGHSWQEILGYYFNGTEVVKIQGE